MTILSRIGRVSQAKEEPLTLEQYLMLWKQKDTFVSLNSAGRILHAIGPAKEIDTTKDAILGRRFSGRTIKTYATFSELYGIEDTVQKIVQFFENAARGLEQSRQILHLLGPVGSGKSTLAQRIVDLSERVPMYVLAIRTKESAQLSPVLESPLTLFDRERDGAELFAEYGIPLEMLRVPLSPWAAKEIHENGNADRFCVVKIFPSAARRQGIARIEFGKGEARQVNALIGTDNSEKDGGYRFNGALNQGSSLLELVEIFKAQDDHLFPLLGATQDARYAGDGGIGVLPFSGSIISHSNIEEWKSFLDTSAHAAALHDRMSTIEVPYPLSMRAESRIYRVRLPGVVVSDDVLQIPASFAVATRLEDPYSHARVWIYDGQKPPVNADKGDSLKSAEELASGTQIREGMHGVSVRGMLKILSDASDIDGDRRLDPVGLFKYLLNECRRGRLLLSGDEWNSEKVVEKITKPIVEQIVTDLILHAFMADYESFMRSEFQAYLDRADKWVDQEDYKHPETGDVESHERVGIRLTALEKGIEGAGTRGFRQQIINDVLHFAAKKENAGKPVWAALDPEVWRQFERNMLPSRKVMIPIIEQREREKKEDREKNTAFLERLCAKGYTPKQSLRIVDFYVQECK